jgi:hypothetical protein
MATPYRLKEDRRIEVPTTPIKQISDLYPCVVCGEGVFLSVRWDEEHHPWVSQSLTHLRDLSARAAWFTLLPDEDGQPKLAVRCTLCCPNGQHLSTE